MSSRRKVGIIVGVALIVFVVLVAIGISASPSVALTNFSINVSGTGPCIANYAFDLVNSGASGIVHVQYKSDGTLIGENNYSVPAHGQIHVTASLGAIDCASHYYTAQITSTSAS